MDPLIFEMIHNSPYGGGLLSLPTKMVAGITSAARTLWEVVLPPPNDLEPQLTPAEKEQYQKIVCSVADLPIKNWGPYHQEYARGLTSVSYERGYRTTQDSHEFQLAKSFSIDPPLPGELSRTSCVFESYFLRVVDTTSKSVTLSLANCREVCNLFELLSSRHALHIEANMPPAVEPPLSERASSPENRGLNDSGLSKTLARALDFVSKVTTNLSNFSFPSRANTPEPLEPRVRELLNQFIGLAVDAPVGNWQRENFLQPDLVPAHEFTLEYDQKLFKVTHSQGMSRAASDGGASVYRESFDLLVRDRNSRGVLLYLHNAEAGALIFKVLNNRHNLVSGSEA